jgi:hypothetical protein
MPGYNPCRKPAASVLRSQYGASLSSQTVTIYSNGALAPNWQSWSYGGTFDMHSSADPYPGHDASFSATLSQNGAYSFYSASAATTGFSNVTVRLSVCPSPLHTDQFNLDCTNSSAILTIFLCTCDDCSTCNLVARDVASFRSPIEPCALASSWASSYVVRSLQPVYFCS